MQTPVTQSESPYELNRRLENLIRTGTVIAVRTQNPARCRVQLGDNTTDWLPWITGRAGGPNGGRSWWPPVVGEQCLVVSPGGDLLSGVVIPGIYSDAMGAPSDQAGCERNEWAPNNFWQWLNDALHIRCEQAITLQVGDNVTLVMTPTGITLSVGGNTSLRMDSSGIYATPDVIGGGRISLVNHVHPGVEPGEGNTKEPR